MEEVVKMIEKLGVAEGSQMMLGLPEYDKALTNLPVTEAIRLQALSI